MNTKQLMSASMEAVQEELPANAFLAPLQDMSDEKTDEIIEGTITHAQTELVAMESIDALMDRYINVMSGLEQIAERLDQYGDAPMDALAVGVLNASVESVTIGLEDQELTIPELNAKLREGASTSSEQSEGVREKAKKIMERIIAFLKAVWNRLVDVFHKLMGGASVVRHRITRLEEALKQHNLRGNPSSNQLDVTHNERVRGIYEALRIGTTFPGSAVQTAKALNGAQTALNEVDAHMIDRYELDLNALNYALERQDATAFARSMSMAPAVPKVFKRTGSDVRKGVTYEAGPIPGNWVFRMTHYVSMIHIPVLILITVAEQLKPEQEETAATMVPTLSPQELTGLGPAVLKIAEGIEEGRTMVERLRKATGRIEPHAFSKGGSTIGGSIVIEAFQKRYREVGRLTMKVNMAMLKSALALVRWGEGSVAEYPKIG